MKPVASNPAAMRRSGIRELMELAATVPDVLHLEVGDPDFPTPAPIAQAAAQAVRDGFTKYTPTAGLPSLRRALAAKLQRVNGFTVQPEQVVVTHGAVSGLMETFMALLEPGDEVLIPDPGWSNYESMGALVGARVVRYPLLAANDFQPDIADLEPLVTPATKAILFNNPGNPTGAVFDRATVEATVAFARRHDLYLISDECYDEMVFEGEHVSPARFDPDGRVVSLFSFSKTYAMTGWRLGYCAASPDVAALIAKIQEPVISCPSAVSQKAGEAALNGPQDCVQEMRDAYRRRRDLAVALLRERNLFVTSPQGAFYILADIIAVTRDSYAFAKELVMRSQVAVAPGEAFGPHGAGLVRLSLATDDATLAEGIRRLADAVAALRAAR